MSRFDLRYVQYGRLTRPVTTEECPWLPGDLPQGLQVRRYFGPTYGCVAPSGVAVLLPEVPDDPFFEVPADAIVWEKETP